MSSMSDVAKNALLDSAKADAFASRLLSVLNHGALCLMIAVGHRVGLFDAMRELPPVTSDELARHVGLNERYVREWLGAMATGRVVEVDAESNRFSLPPEHAAFLT
ncbi:MAG: transcriptional regulator, partial [Candidatus Binatia bacterium]